MKGSIKEKREDTDIYNSHIYKVLLPLIKHLKEEHNLTKEDLFRLMK